MMYTFVNVRHDSLWHIIYHNIVCELSMCDIETSMYNNCDIGHIEKCETSIQHFGIVF